LYFGLLASADGSTSAGDPASERSFIGIFKPWGARGRTRQIILIKTGSEALGGMASIKGIQNDFGRDRFAPGPGRVVSTMGINRIQPRFYLSAPEHREIS